MPPRTRTRATKVLKENVEAVQTDSKPATKSTKQARKPLADKTNSLSDDDNTRSENVKKKSALKTFAFNVNTENVKRPKRDRRPPPRYIENPAVQKFTNSPQVKQDVISSTGIVETKSSNISSNERIEFPLADNNKHNNPVVSIIATRDNQESTKVSGKVNIPTSNLTSKTHTFKLVKPVASRPKRNCRLLSNVEKAVVNESSPLASSPFKSPSKDLENSLNVKRPKRVSRLPSRFEDHSISPSKFIPVQPCFASTPLQIKNTKALTLNENHDKVYKKQCKGKFVEKLSSKKTNRKTKSTKLDSESYASVSSESKSSPDTNNNGKKSKRTKRVNVLSKLQTNESNKITPFTRRILDKSLSFRVLDDKKKSKDKTGLDIYEFTFDPNEEPPPQKKKRKRNIKKKPTKPKTVKFLYNYNDNMLKALSNIKSKIKPSKTVCEQNNVKPSEESVLSSDINKKEKQNIETKLIATNLPPPNYSENIAPALPSLNDTGKSSIHESNYASIRVEDIAADFQLSDHHDINYSPVSSPHQPPTAEVQENCSNKINALLNKDPLNLQDDISFFDEIPVASSSMNVSVRHPQASPWRVDFENLPVKWHSNTYVKPNMTPAVESSFVCSSDTAKKHVYTNMVPQSDALPEILDSAPKLKQPSIISFIKEVAERNANKKKRRRSPSPIKFNSIFDVVNESNRFGHNSPKKSKHTTDTSDTSSVSNNKTNKENSNQSSNKSMSPEKLHKKKDKDATFFGFDDSQNVDLENVSPVKNVPQPRGLRSRVALKDLNTQVGPMRAILPIASKKKLTSSEVTDKIHEQLKNAEDAQFPEKETVEEPANDTVNTNVDDPSWRQDNDDSDSVHLFEDIELVHHLKALRKSYGKAKKVTFQGESNSDSDSQPPVADPAPSSDEDLFDLTFQMPDVKQKKTIKKKKKKNKFSKKEEKKMEEWAKGFNSMCEDIDEFPLVVE